MKKLNILPYGAVELKRQINSSTVKGFVISLVFFAIVGLIPSLINSVVNDEKDSKIIEIEKTFEVISVQLTKTNSENNNSENSEVVNEITNNKTFKETYSKKMIPVDVTVSNIEPVIDNSQLLSELGQFEGKRVSSGSNGLLNNGKSLENNTIIQPDDNYNKEYNHKSVQKIPGMDYEKLKSSVIYPTLPKEMNLGGVVHVAALIRKDGKLVKSYIYKSSNSLFNQEALRAINNYNDFSPAFQNERAVDCWIIIPIKFKIK